MEGSSPSQSAAAAAAKASKTPAATSKTSQQSKKQAKKTKEKLAFDIPYDVDVPSLSDNVQMSAIMGSIGNLIFATSNVPKQQKSEEPPQKKAKIENDAKESDKTKMRKREKEVKDKEGHDLRMFVVGVNAVSRIVEKEEAVAKKKVRCVVVVSSSQPASENFVARHIAMCCASIKLPVCVLDTTSAELGKAFDVPSVMAFAVKTEEYFNETNNPKERCASDKEDDKIAPVSVESNPDSDENVKRRKVADGLVSLITENQSKVELPWSGDYGELKPLKASPLKRNPSRIKQHPKKKQQQQQKKPKAK